MLIGPDEKIHLYKIHKAVIGYVEKEEEKGMVSYKPHILNFLSVKGFPTRSVGKVYRDLTQRNILKMASEVPSLPRNLKFSVGKKGKVLKSSSLFLTDFYFERKDSIYYT